MRVAIDKGPLTSGDSIRGVGFYTRHLVKALEKLQSKEFKFDLLTSEEIKENEKHFDVIHIPYFNPFFLTIPDNLTTPIVVTIHDVIPLLYPDNYPAGIKGTFRLTQQKKALKKIAAVITDTQASKKDIVRFLDVPDEKITPTLLAAGEHFKPITNTKALVSVKKKYKLPDSFVLYVGDVNYNKNIPTLIKATQKANVPLVIIGKQAAMIDGFTLELENLNGPRDWVRFLFGRPHPEISHYRELTKLFALPHVMRLGYVDDTDMVLLFNLATLYCQPSLAEGFGLPVVESFACGTPVIISQTQALVEVAGSAALVAKPNEVDDFADKIAKVMTDKVFRDTLSASAIKKSKDYSWAKTAHETLSVYQSIL